MPSPFLLLELSLRPRTEAEVHPGSPVPSTGYRLTGAYAVEIDHTLRRQRSHRLGLRGDLTPKAELFETEAALLARVLAQIEESECLVTARGRQLDVPVLEALALRYGLTLRGHFPLEEPYAARRSPYNPAGHLDLSFFLADGDRRLRGLTPEILAPLAFPALPPQPTPTGDDTLERARHRALLAYLMFLRVQEMRGRLASEEVARRKAELRAVLAPAEAELVQAAERVAAPTIAPTWVDQTTEGYLAFDIETAVDFEGLSRSLGRSVTHENLPQAVAALTGYESNFPPPPFHRVIALAMVHWDGRAGIELERLVLGGRSRLGASLPDESALVNAFWRVGAGKKLLSYNGKRFDLPVLLYRSLQFSVSCGWFLEEKRPAYEQYRHPQSLRQLDVFEQLGGGLSPGRLGDLLQTIGLPGKQGTRGSDVEQLWAAQALDEIGDYCLSDAAQTFLLALRFMGVAGHLDRSKIGPAIALARSRFEREPALAKRLEGASREFFAEG